MELDKEFIEEFLTVVKPHQTDCFGFVYIYRMEDEEQHYNDKLISHIMLHKIGLSLDPRKRVKIQEKNNNQRYTLCA